MLEREERKEMDDAQVVLIRIDELDHFESIIYDDDLQDIRALATIISLVVDLPNGLEQRML